MAEVWKTEINRFFTPSSLGTLSAHVLALTVFTNVVYHAFGWGWPGLSCVIAVVMAVTVAYCNTAEKGKPLALTLFVAVLNGLIVYAVAFGVQLNAISNSSDGVEITTVSPGTPPRPAVAIKRVGPFGTRVIRVPKKDQ